MLDHSGFPVSDYARSKAFYEKALAPLGYSLVMEVAQTANDHPAAGFGANGRIIGVYCGVICPEERIDKILIGRHTLPLC